MNKIKLLIGICFLTLGHTSCAQNVDGLLQELNTGSVLYTSVQSLKMDIEHTLVLDARKQEEYEISHIPGAIWVGETFDFDDLTSLSEDNEYTKVIVYCSIGVRSEDYGERLMRTIALPVYNLYGGIFAWKDSGFDVVDMSGTVTENVHVFSREWKEYLKTGIAVY